MNMKITSPYNFVPVSKHVFYPEWSSLVSQDLPFSDAEDGVIEATLRNVSPLFTRDYADKEYSAHVIENGCRRYFIPATTIKGMLRGVVEIMSFGKMQEDRDYQNRYFGYRDVAGRTSESKAYIGKVAKGQPGWLRKDGDTYVFALCGGLLDKIGIMELKRLYPSYSSDPSVWKSNVSVQSDGGQPSYPKYEKDGMMYRIVCTGKIGGKKHEMLFPCDRGEDVRLDNECVSAFLTVYEGTPGFMEQKDGSGCFRDALERGREIPAFLLKRDDGSMVLGMSRMFKLPYKYSVRDQVKFVQDTDAGRLDFADTLFGYVAGRDGAAKGRVQVGNAFMKGTVDDSSLVDVSGILGTPKASYYPLYIKQKHSPYKTYDSKEGIAGRKLYRIHSGGSGTSLPQGENMNVGTTFRAIPAGQQFRLRIALHNVRKAEIGAILYALTFNGTPGVYCNLGMAKSFGYGKCTVGDVHLDGLEHTPEEYMRSFEEMMTLFLCNDNSSQVSWADSESMMRLVGIMSEHNSETLKMMSLEEYGKSKFEKENPFNLLEEKDRRINSTLSENDISELKKKAVADKVRSGLKDKYNEVREYEASGELDKAKSALEKIINELRMKGQCCDEENQRMNDLEGKIAEQKAEAERAAAKQKAEADKRKLEAGIGAELDKLAGDGKSYSVKEFKVFFQKIDKWKKNADLSERDAAAIYSTATRLVENPSKKDVKELQKPLGQGVWKRLADYVSEDQVRELYKLFAEKA